MPEPPYSSGRSSPIRSSVAELAPELGGVADRVVLHLPHDGRATRAGEQAAHHLAEHLLLVGEVEINMVVRPCVRASSGRRGGARGCRRVSRHGDADGGGGADGARRRAASTSTVAQPQPASSVSTSVTVPREHHRVAGEHRVRMRKCMRPSRPGAGPVGHVALEPGRLVGGVEEDVLGAVALGGELVVVVHRPPVAGGERAEHDGGGRDVVVQLGQRVADGDLVQHDRRGPACTLRSRRSRPHGAVGVPVARCRRRRSARSRSRCSVSTPTSSSRWLRYSTSITQKRPVPSLVVFGSLTDRSTWRRA